MQRKNRLLDAKNFIVYYGDGREHELSGFDLAVLEPGGHDKQSIQKLNQAGTLLLAYLSVVEVHPSSSEYSLLSESDILKISGQPMSNIEYGTYWADLRSNKWQDVLVHKAGRLLNSGYDGIFLDTIGNIDSFELPPEHKASLVTSAVNLLQRLRKLFPNHLLIQNNGLESLYKYTSELIDGVCWENPPLGEPESRVLTESIIRNLVSMKELLGHKVLILIEDGEKTTDMRNTGTSALYDSAYKIVSENGFILYKAPRMYIGSINKPLNIP